VPNSCKLGSPVFVSLYLASSLALFVVTAVSAWMGLFDVYAPHGNCDGIRLLVYIASSGGLGATVYCIRGLYKHHSLGDYDTKYVYWFLFRPWIGTVLGVVAYLLICGGLLVFTSGSAAVKEPPAKSLLVGVAFLAGFSANEFVMKINALTKTLFGVG
jgi:hypothetical protein